MATIYNGLGMSLALTTEIFTELFRNYGGGWCALRIFQGARTSPINPATFFADHAEGWESEFLTPSVGSPAEPADLLYFWGNGGATKSSPANDGDLGEAIVDHRTIRVFDGPNSRQTLDVFGNRDNAARSGVATWWAIIASRNVGGGNELQRACMTGDVSTTAAGTGEVQIEDTNIVSGQEYVMGGTLDVVLPVESYTFTP